MRRAEAVLLATLVGAWIAPPAAKAALNVTHGLTIQPFTNLNQAGTRFFGYLTVLRGGLFRFETRSAAPSTLQVDGSTAPERSMAAGAHFLLIELTHDGQPPAFELLWAKDDGALASVPLWRLTTSRVDTWRLLLLRSLEWARVAVTLLALAYVLVRRRAPLSNAARLRPQTAAFGLFVLLAVMHTWPLAADPAGLSRHDNSDAMLNEWALGWVAHQIVRDPLDLFDANIFFPERNTLAYSEAMLVQGALGAPLIWAGASTLFAYNLVLLAGFALTGWATALVAARWTGDWTAGLAAGIVAAFNAHTLTRLPHLQALHVEFLPLALAALDSLLREPRAGHAMRLAGWFTLQSLASIYLLVFSAFALTAAALARPREWSGRRFRPVAFLFVAAAALSFVLLLPYLQAYWQVHREQGAVRPLADVELYSASWNDYLSSPSRVHFNTWSYRWFTGTALFPGFVALGLAALAVGRGIAWRNPRARMCLAFGLCGLVLSFGTKVPGYAGLYEILPPLQAVRAVSRFGYLTVMAIALLAAFGLAALRARVPPRRWPAIASVLLVALTLEPLVAPIHLTRFSGIPSIYEAVADDPAAVVAELPMPGGFGWFGNARYVLNSTKHWRPLLNGYSGFAPASFHEHVSALAGFPQPAAIAALQATGVTHVFVHLDGYTPEQRSLMENDASLTRMRAEDRTVLYRVTQRSARQAE